MIRCLFCLFMFILATTNAHAGTSGNELLLGELDQLLKERITYVRKKENKINYLKQLSSSEASVDKKYDIISRLIEEYSNFQSDSAFQYIEQNRLLAGSLESKDKLLENRFQYIFLCAQAGLLNEAQHALLELEDQYPDMNMSQKAEYNKQYERLYMNLRELAQNSHLEEEYRRQELKYSRIICGLVPRESKDFYYYSFKQNYAEGNLEEAKKDIASYYQLIDSASNEAARALYHLSLIYKIEKDELNEEQSLICSVMADIKSAVKQNRSLRLLAQIRNDKGDIRRAYRYLDISLQDANFYNTRLRNSQIAEAIPIIQKEYQLQRDKQALYLWAGIVISTFFLLLILGIALYLRKKRKDLSVARSQLLSINDKLNRINCEVQEKNEELQSLTSNLMESDRVKEKYIGHFLKLCSMYILKIGDYQKLVNRKIKSGQIEELYKLNSSTQYLLKESKDFYSQFDEAFLQIYPSFVKELNALLKEDQQYTLKEGEFLNAELRICALIRLGIKDSSQIAEFMGYNPVTVYTYRTKVKSRAKDKNNFDQEILKIGSVHASS
ncbi:regulatory protein SusR [Bacteroides intestinalis CAG:315]|jgi:hypothetical protein|nr:DUF6377 domain-containing protein [Bacteroides intestinalis]CDD97660.1 regulatory protein SusR [Bacteroides intestinalis CAG:315]